MIMREIACINEIYNNIVYFGPDDKHMEPIPNSILRTASVIISYTGITKWAGKEMVLFNVLKNRYGLSLPVEIMNYLEPDYRWVISGNIAKIVQREDVFLWKLKHKEERV